MRDIRLLKISLICFAIGFLILLFTFQSQCQENPFKDKWFVAGLGFNITGGALDAVSTRKGLNTGRVMEVNPIIGSRGERLIPMKVAGVAASALASYFLYRHGHKKSAIILQLVVGGSQVAVAIHNYGQIR